MQNIEFLIGHFEDNVIYFTGICISKSFIMKKKFNFLIKKLSKSFMRLNLNEFYIYIKFKFQYHFICLFR